MSKEMLINVSEGEECRIALLENEKIEEFYIERTSSTSHVGNIYKGRVVNVEPSIQAAFIDFGLGRNGFLHISDLLPSYFGRRGEEVTESVGRKLARRDRPPIQRCLRRGDEIIVQIIKEGIGTKGPTLTTYLSIPGRIIVMMPGMSKMGVSRKIEDEVERRRLRQILDQLEPPQDCGFIIRTAGIGRPKADIQRDLAYLTRLWQQVTRKLESGSGPMSLYTEGDLVTRTVRDIFTPEIDRIIVDNERVAEEVREFIKLTSPRAKEKVEFYSDTLPLFHKYNIEREIEMMYSRHVPLPSGGSLVIDQTEAVVAIDVNSGKFRDHSDAETTAFKTDMEAADEIPRQLKLRDLGGVIICDFIDLRYDRHRRELEHKLHEAFKNDRAKTKVLRMSQFGIIELTRQRMRPSVKRSIYCDCPHCRGSGLVKTPESMSLDVMRKLAIATSDQRVSRVELTVHTDVGQYLNNRKRRQIAELEHITRKRIMIRTGDDLGLDEVRYELFDSRDGVVVIDELLTHAPQSIQEAQLMAVHARQTGRHEPSRGPVRPERRPERYDPSDARFDIEEIEEGGHPSEFVREPSEGHDEEEEAQEQFVEDEPQQQHRPMPQRPITQPSARPPLPQQPSKPAYANDADGGQGEGGEFAEDDRRGRRRRRGRRGRGRGRGDQPYEGGEQAPEGQQGEVFEETPSNVWMPMPGEEDTQPETPAEVEASEQQTIAPAPAQPVRPAPIAKPAMPAPQRRPIADDVKPAPIQEFVEPARPVRKPFKRPEAVPAPEPIRPQTRQPVEPEPVRVAPIAEWTPEAPVRKRAAKSSATAKDEPAAAKAKKGGRKVAAKPVAKKTTASRRGKKAKAEEADVSVGNDVAEPTTQISEGVEEPKVRIADEPTLTRDGDRHLATDEPVDPESMRVVKSRRDLDEVPETE